MKSATCLKVSQPPFPFPFPLPLTLIYLIDLKLKAIEYVQMKAEKSSKVLDFELAKDLKRSFDETFHPTWQCVVGKNFGSEIGFEECHMIYFYLGSTAILLWKAG